MKDRVPTQVLENGAVRMEQFEQSGNSLGYIWLKRADAPSEEGTPLCKSTLLADDAVKALPGLRTFVNPTVSDALQCLGEQTCVELYSGTLAASAETQVTSPAKTARQYTALVMTVSGDDSSAGVSLYIEDTKIGSLTVYIGRTIWLGADNGFLRVPCSNIEDPAFVTCSIGTINPDIKLCANAKGSVTVHLYGIYRGRGIA